IGTEPVLHAPLHHALDRHLGGGECLLQLAHQIPALGLVAPALHLLERQLAGGWRQTAAVTRWACIENASAVEPQAPASARTSAHSSPSCAPPPPSSAGTPAAKRPLAFSSW